jgi:recombination protein RecA
MATQMCALLLAALLHARMCCLCTRLPQASHIKYVLQTTSGGMALKYYASQRIDVRKSKHIDGSVKDGPAQGLKIKAKVVKNKVGPPAGVVLFDIIFKKGVDRVGCLVDAALAMDVLERRGAFYYYVRNGEDLKLGQGRDKAIAFLEDESNAELKDELYAATKARLTPGQGLPDDVGAVSDEDVPAAPEL